MTLKEIAEYEIVSSWWAGFIFWDWGQELAATYYVWKAKRKYARYLAVQKIISRAGDRS